MKGDEAAGLVLSHSGQIFCSDCAALIIINQLLYTRKLTIKGT